MSAHLPMAVGRHLSLSDGAGDDAAKLGGTAILLFLMQLFRLGSGVSLGGRTIAIDDGIILSPNPYRSPRPGSVVVTIPAGVTRDDMMSALNDRSRLHPGLFNAFMLVAEAEQRLMAARCEAKFHLEDFVASFEPAF